MLVDTSALVDYLRKAETDAAIRVRALELSETLAVTDVVVMEVLAGARDEAHLGQLERFLGGFEHLSVVASDDFIAAAALFRVCRSRGETVRRMTDCLIAAIAIRNDVRVLHNDRDFDVLAATHAVAGRLTPQKYWPVSSITSARSSSVEPRNSAPVAWARMRPTSRSASPKPTKNT